MATTSEYVSAFEAETLIQSLDVFNLDQVATPKWISQHKILEKLNIQVDWLIYDLMVIQKWKQAIFPKLKQELVQQHSTASYFILYHEATVTNLLQTVMYHSGSCKEAGESILDLIRILFTSANEMIQWKHVENTKSAQELMSMSEQERFNESIKEMEFSNLTSRLGILRSITDQIKDLPLSALNLLLVQQDMMVTLVYILEASPWLRKRNGKMERFENHVWQKIELQDVQLLSKLEAQIWLTLLNLALEPECKKKYQYSKQNQTIMLKLKDFISKELVDQLPPLIDLQRYLEELVMMTPPDHVPIWTGIQPISELETKISAVSVETVIQQQTKFLLNMSAETKQSFMNQLADIYPIEAMEEMMFENPICAACGLPAESRCSMCKMEWYCGRQCQVGNWKQHKSICELLRNAKSSISNSSLTLT